MYERDNIGFRIVTIAFLRTVDLVAILEMTEWIVVDVTVKVNSGSKRKRQKGFELGLVATQERCDVLYPPVPPILLHQLVFEEELADENTSGILPGSEDGRAYARIEATHVAVSDDDTDEPAFQQR